MAVINISISRALSLLHRTTLHAITLLRTTLCYTTLHYTTLHRTTLHYTTPHYTTRYHATSHYIVLHYTTLHYTTSHHTISYFSKLCTTLHSSPVSSISDCPNPCSLVQQTARQEATVCHSPSYLLVQSLFHCTPYLLFCSDSPFD